MERDSPWQKDGQSHKGKQWFIHIEANKEWVQAAINRMSKYALGETVVGMLQPVNISLDNLPEQAFTEADDDTDPETIQPGNIVDAESTSIDIHPMTYDEARDTIVKVNGGKEKFVGELRKDQLDFLITSEKSTDAQKKAARIVLEKDYNIVEA